jgi:hypothetical protein
MKHRKPQPLTLITIDEKATNKSPSSKGLFHSTCMYYLQQPAQAFSSIESFPVSVMGQDAFHHRRSPK